MTHISIAELTPTLFDSMMSQANRMLERRATAINDLNVFPVPDGDTGTNMSLSLASGEKYRQPVATASVAEQAQALAKGLLMGARGNSGVILSQIFRGLSTALAEVNSGVTPAVLTTALRRATDVAYASVMSPTEGTILTVVAAAAQAAEAQAATDDWVLWFTVVRDAARSALAQTPKLLPILAEVGVVDSGGQGLVTILAAWQAAITGGDIIDDLADQSADEQYASAVQTHASLDPAAIVYGYCTEVMVALDSTKFSYVTTYNQLAELGDSLLLINDDHVLKIHIHTEHPGQVLEIALTTGSLTNVKVDNMRAQQDAIREHQQPTELPQGSQTAVLAISSGSGLEKLFTSMGASVLSGGQTMNPSTDDICQALAVLPVPAAVILVNNSNVILAAEQAAQISDKDVVVVPSVSVQQGLSAMLGYNPFADSVTNQQQMTSLASSVVSGQVTQATRSTQLNGHAIEAGHYLGICDKDIIATAPDLMMAAKATLEVMITDDSDILTVLVGQDGSSDVAQALADYAQTLTADLEVEVHDGGQPLYPFLFSVE